ncbi:MAG: aldehyde dehydrogenase family protein, partial [Acidiferrobacterales bacterium]|nr:aldehyde dehydrogenase family protein [Acidiferrobacterales bacterium]
MAMETINPATGKSVKKFETLDVKQLDGVLQQVADATPAWADRPISERSELMKNLAAELRDNKQHYGGLITLEMGKPITEAVGEIEKCAWACEYYADNAATFLADETIESDAGK